MITIEMNEIGFICWTFVMMFPSFVIALLFLVSFIQDIKNTKKKKSETERKAEIIKNFIEWYEKYNKEK